MRDWSWGSVASACALRLCVAGLVLSPFGCRRDEPVHASTLETPSEALPSTEVEASPDVPLYADGRLESDFQAHEPWIEAEKTLRLALTFNDDTLNEIYISHLNGTIVAGGVDIPVDTWAELEGSLLSGGSRIFAWGEGGGHTLVLDVDVIPLERGGYFDLRGYMIVDDEGELWVEFHWAGST